MDKFIKHNKYYLITLFILLIVFMITKLYFSDYINKIDISVASFITEKVINNNLTSGIKLLTHLGSSVVLVSITLLTLFIIKDKGYFMNISLNLALAFILSVLYKNFIKRERPSVSLIKKPSDYSFPSGHTMCSVAFYGFLIYLVNKNIKNKYIKISLNILFSLVILIVPFTRIYLGVHYLSDVLMGALLGFISLMMYINYIEKENIL